MITHNRNSIKARLRPALLVASVFLALSLLAAFRQVALANPNPIYLTVSLVSEDKLYMDSDDFCNDVIGPDGAYYHLVLTNTHNTQSFVGLSVIFTPPPDLGIDTQEHWVGNIAAGQSADVFFFVDYHALRTMSGCNNGNPPISYNGTFTATIYTFEKKTKEQVLVYTDQLVAAGIKSNVTGGQTDSFELPSSLVTGSLFTTTVLYSYGNNDNNSTLTVQPAGNGDFNAAAFRLVGTRVITSNVDGVNAGVTNQIYFTGVDTGNNDVIKMAYIYQALQGGESSSAKPWSEISLGNDHRYNLNTFGGSSGTLPLPPPEVIETALYVTRTVSPTLLIDGGTATYTITFENRYPQAINITNLRDKTANGVRYAGVKSNSEITPLNSTISPTIGATGDLDWYGIPYVTYQVPPSGTLGTGIPGYTTLVFAAEITTTAGLYTSWFTATVGAEYTSPISVTVEVENTPTSVIVGEFFGVPTPGGNLLHWNTVQEIDLMGFNIYRQASGGKWELITLQPVNASAPGSLEGALYGWLDPDVTPGVTYEYALVVLPSNSDDPADSSTRASITALDFIFLPFIVK